MARMKACEGCAFYDMATGTCLNVKNDVPDPIEGSVHNFARYARQPNGPCGPQARYFKRRPSATASRLQGRVGAFVGRSARVLATGVFAGSAGAATMGFATGLFGFELQQTLPLTVPLGLTLATFMGKILWRMTGPEDRPTQAAADPAKPNRPFNSARDGFLISSRLGIIKFHREAS